MMHVMSHQSQQPTQVCVRVQMVDMEVVVVLVMAMECDGAFMVTITTLVSCNHTHAHSEEGDGKRDSGGFTPPHNTIKWWLVGVAGVQPSPTHQPHTHQVAASKKTGVAQGQRATTK